MKPVKPLPFVGFVILLVVIVFFVVNSIKILPEYEREETLTEKQQETFVQLRRLWGNQGVSFLASTRTQDEAVSLLRDPSDAYLTDYATQTEYLPSLTYHLVNGTLLSRDTTGFAPRLFVGDLGRSLGTMGQTMRSSPKSSGSRFCADRISPPGIDCCWHCWAASLPDLQHASRGAAPAGRASSVVQNSRSVRGHSCCASLLAAGWRPGL